MEVVANRPDFTDTDVPRKPDGSNYRYGMGFDKGRRIAFADQPGDLLELLIDGYADIRGDVHQEAVLRVADALWHQGWHQAMLMAELTEEATALTDEERVIVTSNKVETGQPAIIEWAAAMPLVLCTHDYQPFGSNTPKPQGNILWLETTEEYKYLVSLAHLGVIEFAEPNEYLHADVRRLLTEGELVFTEGTDGPE